MQWIYSTFALTRRSLRFTRSPCSRADIIVTARGAYKLREAEQSGAEQRGTINKAAEKKKIFNERICTLDEYYKYIYIQSNICVSLK